MQPADGESPALLRMVKQSSVVVPVQGTAAITSNPLAAYDTRSVVGFVTSAQPNLRSAAELELRNRGFSAGDLELAARLMSTDSKTRLAMIEEVVHRSDIDPRRWLVWLASDAERDVRLEAIARLGTMDDPQVRSALQTLLNDERDPTVASRLRRFLGLR